MVTSELQTKLKYQTEIVNLLETDIHLTKWIDFIYYIRWRTFQTVMGRISKHVLKILYYI